MPIKAKFSVSLSQSAAHKVKMLAAREGRQQSDVIREAVRIYLADLPGDVKEWLEEGARSAPLLDVVPK